MCGSRCPSAGAVSTCFCFWPGSQGIFVCMGVNIKLFRERKPGSANHPRLPFRDLSRLPTFPSLAPSDSAHRPHLTPPCLDPHCQSHGESPCCTRRAHTQPHTPDSEPGRLTREQIPSDINKERQYRHFQDRQHVFCTKTHTQSQPPHVNPAMRPHCQT